MSRILRTLFNVAHWACERAKTAKGLGLGAGNYEPRSLKEILGLPSREILFAVFHLILVLIRESNHVNASYGM